MHRNFEQGGLEFRRVPGLSGLRLGTNIRALYFFFIASLYRHL